MNSHEREYEVLPVTVRHIDEPDVEDRTCATLDELGEELEFYDEFAKERLEVTSVTGTPLRVIAHALEVLLCIPVARFAAPGDLTISRCQREGAPGEFGFAEVYEGRVHRILWDNRSVDPSEAFGTLPRVSLIPGETPTAKVFSEQWASCASNRSWP